MSDNSTYTDLAQRIEESFAKTGLSSSTIAKMTNCESVKLSVLEKICKELDCNFGDLIDYVPDNKEK